ncbi:helix-turn-helix domain-containing protein [Bdellovibrio sp. 22V]|uniref:GlxA family transcriptional regulator n=1 Tax=Bdellovibrio sp. 22V TaxID=3044166 RepID=UPI002543ABB0|nr:helix-turn-helix domain-containing protein [Bdellovibrio sp. 22V]WII71359.1 helix-turn-helix domain-containing protein [Bdellovibrio sp. 22V]
MLKVGFLVYPDCMPAGLFAGLDLLKTANTVSAKKLFEGKIVALSRGPVLCAHGQTVVPETSVREFDFDMLIIPGFWAYSAESVKKICDANADVQKYLNRISKEKMIGSYCVGSVFHARTSRLHNRTATATWWLARDLKNEFPKVRWQVNKISAGDLHDMTASGANGFYPLMTRVLAEFAGKKILTEVQKYLMTPTQFNANDPFYELETLTSKERVLKLRKFVEKTPARDLSLVAAADFLGVSVKTLSRKMREDLKWTPAVFFRMVKFKQAGAFLITTEDSVAQICDALGFDDEASFRKGFKNCVGMTPTEYRRKYQR